MNFPIVLFIPQHTAHTCITEQSAKAVIIIIIPTFATCFYLLLFDKTSCLYGFCVINEDRVKVNVADFKDWLFY